MQTQVLDLRARSRTNAAIQMLLGLAPNTARIVHDDGAEEDIPLEQVHPSDVLRVRPGEKMPDMTKDMPRDYMEMMSGMMKAMSKQIMDMSYCLEKGVVSTMDMKSMRDKMMPMQKNVLHEAASQIVLDLI